MNYEKISYEANRIIIHKPKNFSLSDVFDCGQCFRFNRMYDHTYCGVAFGKYIELHEKEDRIEILNVTKPDFEEIWSDFFDLDFDYEKCISDFSFDTTLKAASKYASGIRILHQEHWETICSFIISQNNNIPRIKKIIEALSEKYGEHIYTDSYGKKYYSFPTAQSLYNAGEQAIYEMKTGFRAKYIYDAAKKVTEGTINFDTIENMDTEEALEYISTIKGVGPKVASCILLFSFRKYDCFPIDVWVKKILSKYYPDFSGKEYFGKYAGIAQQYLFHYERSISGIDINKEKKQ